MAETFFSTVLYKTLIKQNLIKTTIIAKTARAAAACQLSQYKVQACYDAFEAHVYSVENINRTFWTHGLSDRQDTKEMNSTMQLQRTLSKTKSAFIYYLLCVFCFFFYWKNVPPTLTRNQRSRIKRINFEYFIFIKNSVKYSSHRPWRESTCHGK